MYSDDGIIVWNCGSRKTI